MALESVRTDILVAAAAAGATVAVSLILEYVLVVELSVLLQLLPLSVYVLYTFTHSRLPETVDRPATWIAATAAVSLAVIGYALV